MFFIMINFSSVNITRIIKKNLIKNQVQNSDLKIECIEGNKLIDVSNNEKNFDVVYPSVG